MGYRDGACAGEGHLVRSVAQTSYTVPSPVRPRENTRSTRAIPGRKSIRSGIPESFRCGDNCVGFNPGDSQLMMAAHVLEELANVLNDRFVAAGLDRVVREETNAVLAVVRSQGQGP